MGGGEIPWCCCDLLTGVAQPAGERSREVAMAPQAQNCRSHQLRYYLPVFFMQRPSHAVEKYPYVLKNVFLRRGSYQGAHRTVSCCIISSHFSSPFSKLKSLNRERHLHMELINLLLYTCLFTNVYRLAGICEAFLKLCNYIVTSPVHQGSSHYHLTSRLGVKATPG